MSDILLNDTTWDVDITANELRMVTGADEIKQLWKQRLQAFLGEWFLDVSIGLPWFQMILQKAADINLVRAALLTETVNTPGILEILKFDLTLDTAARTLRVDATVRVESGIINFSEEFPA